MNRKRNVSFIKPEDPEFLKVLKRQAGYDDSNHKFDKLENADEDFIDDDGDSEQPQVVVLKKGDLTAEEAEEEQKSIEKKESETKADLTQRVIFKSKNNVSTKKSVAEVNKGKRKVDSKTQISEKKHRQLLSFGDCDDDDDED